MSDPTEDIRRHMIDTDQPTDDLFLELAANGPVWTTEQLQKDFEVTGFMAPFVVVRRREDGVKGTLEFTHSPRYYFGFTAAS